jgi:hypothetical protein
LSSIRSATDSCTGDSAKAGAEWRTSGLERRSPHLEIEKKIYYLQIVAWFLAIFGRFRQQGACTFVL